MRFMARQQVCIVDNIDDNVNLPVAVSALVHRVFAVNAVVRAVSQ